MKLNTNSITNTVVSYCHNFVSYTVSNDTISIFWLLLKQFLASTEFITIFKKILNMVITTKSLQYEINL